MTLEDHFRYYTECELATLEHLKRLKSTSKSELRRHGKIAEGMVAICKEMSIDTRGTLLKCPRLEKLLTDQGLKPKGVHRRP